EEQAIPEKKNSPDQAFSYLNEKVSYEDVKEAIRPFVKDNVAPYLTNHNNNREGIAFYEASCGEGWNLWLTLELLQEGIDQSTGIIPPITVYGSDPDGTSVAFANQLLKQKQTQHQAYSDNSLLSSFSIGSVCQAESTNLSHVPSNVFDMVFAGHLQLLSDPLELWKEGDETDPQQQRTKLTENYLQVCSTNLDVDHWMENKLLSIVQQRQVDWVGQWVAEMARIAKPGAPIILEHLSSKSFCESVQNKNEDGGGLNRNFWKIHAEQKTYGWDVDPESIVLQDDNDRIDSSRYHVLMLKKKDATF
ncbi:MAG: hypothetical protein SGILL_003908, partial [Bacillariaceae sp.]